MLSLDNMKLILTMAMAAFLYSVTESSNVMFWKCQSPTTFEMKVRNENDELNMKWHNY